MLFVSIRLHAYWSGDHEAVSTAEEVDDEDDDEDMRSKIVSNIGGPFAYPYHYDLDPGYIHWLPPHLRPKVDARGRLYAPPNGAG